MRLTLITFLIVFSHNTLFAQTFSFGLGASLGNTFPVGKTKSEVYKETGSIGFGLNVPVRVRIHDRLSLITGLNLQRKTYKISHLEYKFPELTSTGGFTFGLRNNVVQIPLMVSVKLWNRGAYTCFLSTGINYAYYQPWAYTGESDWTPQYSGNVLFNYETGGLTQFNSTSGIELSSAVSLFISEDQFLKHEFSLGMEYSTFKTPGLDYRIVLFTNSDSKEYLVSEQSKLLFFKLSYTRYIKFKKE